jgi:hypothetical protein
VTDVALAAQLLASGVMLGVIWIVQLLLYPAFAHVAAADWSAHHGLHSQRITFVVLPAMAVELGVAVGLLIARPADLAGGLLVANLALVVATWGITAYVARRHHGGLGRGWNAGLIRSLVRVNWWRTAAWTAHAGVALTLVLSRGG